MPVVTFYEAPTAENFSRKKGALAALGHGGDSPGENSLEEIEQAFVAEIDAGLIIVEIRLAGVFQIFGVILVQLNNPLDHCPESSLLMKAPHEIGVLLGNRLIIVMHQESIISLCRALGP